jgi:hypothetical protein
MYVCSLTCASCAQCLQCSHFNNVIFTNHIYNTHHVKTTTATELAQLRAVLLAANYTVSGIATVLRLGAAAATGVGVALQNVSAPTVAATIAKALPSEVSTAIWIYILICSM